LALLSNYRQRKIALFCDLNARLKLQKTGITKRDDFID